MSLELDWLGDNNADIYASGLNTTEETDFFFMANSFRQQRS